MNTVKVGFLAMGLSLAGGCGNVLFHDSFDDDTIGSRPNLVPPGDPVGDLIYMSDPAGTSLEVVSGAEAGDHDLKYQKTEASDISRYVGFLSKQITPDERAFTLIWNAKANLFNQDGPLDIWVGNTHFGAIAGIRIDNGRVLKRQGESSYIDIGAFRNDVDHTVVWTIDRDAETYSLLLSGGGISISVDDEPITGQNELTYLMTPRPTLYLLFGEGGTGASSYTIDNLRIAETDEET